MRIGTDELRGDPAGRPRIVLSVKITLVKERPLLLTLPGTLHTASPSSCHYRIIHPPGIGIGIIVGILIIPWRPAAPSYF